MPGLGGRTSPSGNAVSKALRVLEAVAAEPGFQPLGEVADRAALPKATTFRVLATLAAEEYVIRHPRRGYAAGPRLRTIGRAADSIDGVLADLSRRTGQTSNFALRVRHEAIYTHQQDGSQPYRISATLGTRFALHGTAIGKSILAFSSATERDALIDGIALPPLTEHTMTDEAALRAELDAATGLGYTVDDEENESDVRCIAAPVFGPDHGVVGAVSLSALTYSATMEDLVALAPAVRAAADRISDLLSGRG